MEKENWQRIWKGKMEFLAFIYENNGKLGENEGEMSHVACEEENEGK